MLIVNISGAAGKGGAGLSRGPPGSSGEPVQVVIKDSPVILRQVCILTWPVIRKNIHD